MRIDQLDGPDSHRPGPTRRQERRVRGRYAENGRRVLLGEAAGAQEQKGRQSHFPMVPLNRAWLRAVALTTEALRTRRKRREDERFFLTAEAPGR